MERLWAPWRLEYIQSADAQPGCVFCTAAELSDEDGLVVHRDDLAFVLLNKYPYSSGHLMVAPRRHVGHLGALLDDEVVEMTGIDEERAKEIILKARAHWFE